MRASWWTRAWIWGLLPAFVIHDGEEAIHIALSDGLFRGDRLVLTTSQALAGIVMEFTVGWLVVLAATRSARPGWPIWIFAALTAGWTAHGLGHLVAGTVSDGYVMGVITALPFAFTYGVLALCRLYRVGLLSKRALLISAPVGLAAAWPLIMIAHAFGRMVS